MVQFLDVSREGWGEWVEKSSGRPFLVQQIEEWIYQKQIVDPNEFTNIGKKWREALLNEFSWDVPQIDSHLISKDGSEKFLLLTHDRQLFEMVLMPYDNRVTLCISSQVGCKMGCTFCQTGKLGLKRNLTAGEILSQIYIANRHLEGRRVTNIVFMGMGEPLDNYNEVVKACKRMVDPQGLGLSKHRVTVSTAGLVPEIERLGKDLPVRLAISLHNADGEKRSKMMPVNRKYPLTQLKKVLQNFPAPSRYGVTIEYVMIEGENDATHDANNLVCFLKGIRAKVNLIPINHFPGMEMKASEEASLRSFQDYLVQRGVPTSIRYSRGQDISGGCGQLATKREEELELDPRKIRKLRAHHSSELVRT